MFEILLTVSGFFLLFLVFYETYATILRATKRTGPISQNLNRTAWFLFKNIAKRSDRRWRHRLLNPVAPLLLPFLFSLFIFLLITGFALIYYPQMETGFYQSDQAKVTDSWMQAFYFSGVTLFTIGYGDVVPNSGAMRFLAIVQGLSGIAMISLAVTYLLTVYGALERKRAVALNFYHQAAQGADVANFITRHYARGRFYGLTDELKTATRDLQEMLETHLEHPVIHYFHPLEVYKSLPRALFFVLEAVALLQACLKQEEYVEAGDHPDVMIAGENARYVLAELLTALSLEKVARKDFESQSETLERRRKCFQRAVRQLSSAKIALQADLENSFRQYSAERDEWERQLFHFTDFLGYDWDEITGDRSLEDATDDEIIERHKPLVMKNEVEKTEEN